jgi:hypothetical protein
LSNILIIGDSFAADWSTKYQEYMGWPNLLAEQHTVTNLAQAGVSEYKIYRQLLTVDLQAFDVVIVAHTSPYRVPTRQHPVHSNDILHKNADLICTDVEYHAKKLANMFNRRLQAAREFFTYHFDEEFFEDSYILFREKINKLLSKNKVIVISSLSLEKYKTEKYVLDFVDLLVQEPGLINHFSQQGNRIVYERVVSVLNTLKENK